MAYEVTATRRRPQSFNNLVGQEFVAETLKNAIQSNKIAHAYLFSGPRGCGKTSTARILAKALNCEKGPTATPCGECSACKEITAGSSLDVIEIDGASNTSVNDVRQIKDEVLFPPNSCRYKIYIIDEVHMLSTSAFNALLKTIEEPPHYAIFIFATTELQKVPATIKSRCQQFNFRLVPIEKVKEQLALAAQEIGIKADDEALYWIARESTGSMRDSYTLFDQVAAFSDGEITYEKIRDKLGLVGVDRLNELFGLCVAGDSASAILKLDEYLQNGVSIEQLITNCTDYLRSILLLKNGITKESLLGQSGERFNKDVLDAWSSTQIERALSLFMQLFRDIRYSLSPRYEFELTISRLAWLKEYASPAEVKKALDKIQPLLSSSSVMQAAPQSAAPLVSGGVPQAASQALSQARMPASSYVPKFSALSQEGVQSAPFSNGGAEPPAKNSAPVSFSADNSTDDSYAAAPDDYAPAPDEYQAPPDDYSPAPEEYAVPPEGFGAQFDAPAAGSQSDGGMQSHGSQQSHDSLQTPDSSQTSVSPQTPAAPQTAGDELIPSERVNTSDMARVRQLAVSDFTFSDTMTGTLLAESSEWTLSGDTVTCTMRQRFQLLELQKHTGDISRYLTKLFGRQIQFRCSLEEIKTQTQKVELPLEVQLLCDTFRAEVLGMK